MAGHVKPVTNERDVVSDCVKKGVRVVRLDSLSCGAAAARNTARSQHTRCLDPPHTSGWDTAKVITAVAEVHHLVGGHRLDWKRHNRQPLKMLHNYIDEREKAITAMRARVLHIDGLLTGLKAHRQTILGCRDSRTRVGLVCTSPGQSRLF
jgi:hypothetical protein